VLCFEPRTPPEIEPLIPWTGGDDTLTQVELTLIMGQFAGVRAGCVIQGSGMSGAP